MTEYDPKNEENPLLEEVGEQDDEIIGVAMKWSVVVLIVIAVAVAVGIWLNRDVDIVEPIIDRDPVVAPDPLDTNAEDRPVVRFVDITTGSGIDFVHERGAEGEKLLPETMGGGVAVFDYDNDGDQDIFFVNSKHWPHSDYDGPPAKCAMYANDGTGTFTDVTEETGLGLSIYGMGVACGDYDCDGDIDLFVTALGPDIMLRNDDGRFVDVTEETGVAGPDDGWSTSAGFFDADGDGDLDLFVCDYLLWSREIDNGIEATLDGVHDAYAKPQSFQGRFSRLYRNDDGVFTDVSEEAGIYITNPATGRPMGKALAVTFADVEGDHDLDILVANDTVQNFVFRNHGDGTFEEVGVASSLAFDANGMATGAMGTDIADVENNRQLCQAIANFANEATSFYVQQPDNPWSWSDMSAAEGIGSPSRLKLSFGLFFFDYDLDGRLDMVQANGHLENDIHIVQDSQTYEQAAQLFWNAGNASHACYVVVPEDEVGDLADPMVGRGAAYGDFDHDGDLDVVLTQVGGPPMLLRNDQDLNHHWLRVELEGEHCSAETIGAWVELTANGKTQRRQVMPTRSYLSQVELPLTFGLGETETIDGLQVIWPDGTEQNVEVSEIDTVLRIKRGS